MENNLGKACTSPSPATKKVSKLGRRGTAFALLVVLLTLISTLLAACGDNTPAPASQATSAAAAAPTVNTPVQLGNASSFSTPIATTGSSATTAAAGTTAAAATTAAAGTTAATAAAATTAAAASGSAKPGGTLHLAIGEEPDALDPDKTILLVSDAINVLIYDRLVYIGRDGLPKPWLAQSWDIGDSGKTLTFKIRPNLKFTDGTPLDAKAVKFTFDRILDPKTASPAKAQMGTLLSVDAPDEQTAVFKFSEAFAPFFTNISLGYGGIVSPTAVAKSGDQFGRNPVGSGPFMFKSWKTGSEIVLVKNPDYKNLREDGDNKGGPAYLDSIVYTVIVEPGTRIAALQQGSLDIGDLQPENASTISQDSRFTVYQWKTATNMNFLEFPNKAPFTDAQFRKGIAYAIDKKALLDSAWNGYATLNQNPMPVGDAGWDSTSTGYGFDVAKAKQTFADDGWKPGSNGILEKDGKPASFTLTTYGGSSVGKRITEIVQANLKTVGIDVKVQIVELSALLAQLKKGDFDIDLMRWTWPDPTILSLLFKSPGWTGQFSDPELDKVLIKADTTLDPTQRLAVVKDAQKQILDKAVIVPLSTDWIQEAVQKKVHGYKWDAIGYQMYTDVWMDQ